MPGVLRLAITKAFRKSALLFETFEYQYEKQLWKHNRFSDVDFPLCSVTALAGLTEPEDLRGRSSSANEH